MSWFCERALGRLELRRSVAVLELTLRGVALCELGDGREEGDGLLLPEVLRGFSRGSVDVDDTLPIPKNERWVEGLLGGDSSFFDDPVGVGCLAMTGGLLRPGSGAGGGSIVRPAPLGRLPAPQNEVPAAIFSLCVIPRSPARGGGEPEYELP